MPRRPALLLPLLMLAACAKEPAPPADAPAAMPEAAAPVDEAMTAPADAAAVPAGTTVAAAGNEPTATPPAADDLASLATRTDTLATLRGRHGEANVVEADVPMGEGTTEPGWVIFPGNPDPVRVYLDADGKPSDLIVEGAVSGYGTHGVHLGMTLPALQALNGKPFATSGFGWDYGGRVVDWAEGALAGKGVSVGFCLPEGDWPADLPMGEEAFESNDPRLAAFVPTVCSLGQQL